jgi:hypothetical protein
MQRKKVYFCTFAERFWVTSQGILFVISDFGFQIPIPESIIWNLELIQKSEI